MFFSSIVLSVKPHWIQILEASLGWCESELGNLTRDGLCLDSFPASLERVGASGLVNQLVKLTSLSLTQFRKLPLASLPKLGQPQVHIVEV